MIEVENLVKQYGENTVVKGISFKAEQGITGFLGPNGAGKTTTMRILTAYVPPTSGRAKVAGYDVFENSMEVRQRVGYLPENVPLYRDLTAVEYLSYLAEIRGVRNRKQRALEVLARVGLVKRADSRIRTLSKGMKQRVGLAAALIHDPQVLILDEPTIGLDPLQVLELRNVIRELGREHTVMFSTHILSEAEQLCDHVVIINRGEILATGTPLELRHEMERGSRFLLRTNAPPQEAEATLLKIEGIVAADSFLEDIMITPASRDYDPRPAVAKTFVEKGWDVIEIRSLTSNLEDVFIELTRQATFAAMANENAKEETA
jgi:ABC-2 type transport system ATP-binding protein